MANINKTHLEAERRYQFATQKLINLKWHLTELSKHSTDRYVRTQLTLLAGDTAKDIANLLAEDFVYAQEDLVKLP
jgi:hypothetical protein